uniref:Defensin-A n=1 Tax=Glossina morsitans morsitans TaxID=37546 RepID=DEF_GLOMM|nr:RecName: Full=Defensin-A; Short=DefA; Short=GmDefA; Flags: Precursor [Glossina morsitans morsitans]AAL34112.1 antimicrobial peptide defensin DefA [Glossina morsitans morsitans]
MKFYLVLAFLTLCAVAVTALPAGDETRIDLETLEEDLRLVDGAQVTGELKRDKRVTCNIGEWVCVAHCNSKSKKSGYCSRGVCYCTN